MEEIKDTAVAEQELSEVLRIRREKLANLQADGNDPFVKLPSLFLIPSLTTTMHLLLLRSHT